MLRVLRRAGVGWAGEGRGLHGHGGCGLFVPSKMIVEFKTRAGDKWTSLRHYDSGPWSGGGNPHWAAINVTLRAVKSNAGIGERKKDVQD